MDLGSNIAQLRERRGLSQAALAKEFNISQATLAMYETNKRRPNVEMLDSIADYFNVTTDYLLGRTPTPQFTAKNERDVQNIVDDLINGLSNENSLAYLRNGGEEIDEEDAELIKDALEKVARRSKILAKEKFTPNKYK